MHVSSLSLVDFRSYPSAAVDLDAGVVVVSGANGSGKTNLVEAIGYAASLRSHRVAADGPLVRMGADRAVVRVGLRRGARDSLIEVEIVPGRANRARLNRAPVPKPRDVLGHLRRVLFAPEDLSLVKGEPGQRRDMLDELLTVLAPRFAGVLDDIDRVLRQRNALLRSGVRTQTSRVRDEVLHTLTVWDERLVPLAAELTIARSHLVSLLTEPLRDRYREVAPEHTSDVSVTYVSGTPGTVSKDRDTEESRMRDVLESRRGEELARGQTLVGPHRDEVGLLLNGMPLRGYASQGESWSMALALRLAGLTLLQSMNDSGGDPVLILDDVFSELDDERRDRLVSAVSSMEQVIITAAAPGDVPARLRERAQWVTPDRFRAGVGT